MKTLLLFIAGIFGFTGLSAQHVLAPTGFFSYAFHDYEITALSDGSITLNFNALIPQAKKGVVDSLLNLDRVKNPVAVSVNAYVIKHGSKLILIDAGAGSSMGSSLGQLPVHLKRAGYDPSQIDVVLLTHIHADHSNGLLDQGKRVFPKATLYVNQVDLDFWLSKTQQDAAVESEKKGFIQARRVVDAYAKANRLKTFQAGSSLLEGITALASPGHTLGHTYYRLSSGTETLLFIGDGIHSAPIQLREPCLSTYFDRDTMAAAIQRKKLLEQAATHHYLIAGAHLDFPGMGYIRKKGKLYEWMPLKK
ncbi:MBL fold metallo-hydrolase [Siphonobacter sp. SORGH_AS_1065]|uniref:MBL fold metallo-hydrolase n=1 Tax=Siphonobacter sp. SORGH_AS_1065 TaxID=3041795 RepID=UPI002783EB88|nr:MBL fold metallo-hydrolase [Siphonobacter sp. SORGH_AS_1065]MDQ1086710.1 glyoxylase-like metal-dependent hydrolase (beta-lactamase superfamily II) [Siphonobacter sp. SORGH_AS_1065]